MAHRSRPRAGGRRLRPTLRGISMAVVGVVLIVLAYVSVRIELLYVGSLALLLPVIAVLYVGLRRIRVHVARSYVAHSLVAGYRATGTIELSNLSPSTTPRARWWDVLPWGPHATVPSRLPPLRWRTERATLEYTLTPPRRGVFEIGPLVIELSDPFGLARSEIAVGERQRIVVVPDIETLPTGGVNVSADDGTAHRQRFRTLSGDDDVSTRAYRRGDALRRVHWRASAHRGELMVREEEQHSHAEARIILDTTRHGYRDLLATPQPHEPESEQFEWAVRAAATLALNLGPHGFQVQFVETGPQQLAPPSEHDEFLESTAALRLTASTDPHALALSATPGADSSLGVLCAVIADAEPGTIEALALQRAQFDLAIAVIVTSDFGAVARPLTDRGWQCIEAPPAESVLPLWGRIAAILEARHAPR